MKFGAGHFLKNPLRQHLLCFSHILPKIIPSLFPLLRRHPEPHDRRQIFRSCPSISFLSTPFHPRLPRRSTPYPKCSRPLRASYPVPRQCHQICPHLLDIQRNPSSPMSSIHEKLRAHPIGKLFRFTKILKCPQIVMCQMHTNQSRPGLDLHPIPLESPH